MEPFMELSRTRDLGSARRRHSQPRRAMVVRMKKRPNEDERLLAPLSAGDQLPWKLSSDGEPLWLTVTEVVGQSSYLVRYPDGSLETLTDSE
jgi:hypothetical protein